MDSIKKIYIILFILSAANLFAQSSPSPGAWEGKDITFKVSSDKTTITDFIVVMYGNGFSETVQIHHPIPITGGMFQLTDRTVTINGYFDSKNSAHGNALGSGSRPSSHFWIAYLNGTQEAIKQFFVVVESGTPQQVKDAIDQGADVNTLDEHGLTPLMEAARINSHYPEVLTTLVAAGADVKAQNNEALRGAAMFNGNPEVITVLLKAGADVNAKALDGGTPLLAAANKNNNPEVITVLLKAGADLKARGITGGTPLITAAMFTWNPEVVMVLLKAGADVRAKDFMNYTALDWAQKNKRLKGTEALKMLEEASNQNPSVSQNPTNIKLERTFSGHSAWVSSVAFSPDGKYALSGSGDKTMKLWDMASGKEVRTSPEYSYVSSVALSSDGNYALSGSYNVKLWDLALK
jgi:hypothetical protein